MTRSLPPPVRSIVLRISLKTCWSGWSFTVLKAVSVKAANVRSCAQSVHRASFCRALARPGRQRRKRRRRTPSTNAAASRLLLQLSEALQGHSQNQFLALFDLAKMKNGPIFKQQIGVFFSQTESIRVHLNLVEVVYGRRQGHRGRRRRDGSSSRATAGLRARRNERLNFVVANAGGNWKFVDVQPRVFLLAAMKSKSTKPEPDQRSRDHALPTPARVS